MVTYISRTAQKGLESAVQDTRGSLVRGNGQGHGCARGTPIGLGPERGLTLAQPLPSRPGLFPAVSPGSGLTKLGFSQAGWPPGGFGTDSWDVVFPALKRQRLEMGPWWGWSLKCWAPQRRISAGWWGHGWVEAGWTVLSEVSQHRGMSKD